MNALRIAVVTAVLAGASMCAQTTQKGSHPPSELPESTSGPQGSHPARTGDRASSQTAYGMQDYSPLAAGGGYRRPHATFWEFWWSRINPGEFNYGAWIEQRRRVFLEQAGANRYFWFSFWSLTALCFLLLWLAKERMDRKDVEWESAACLADLANYAEYCKRHALEAIRQHNEHIETCNRVIESGESGGAYAGAADGGWKAEVEKLTAELAQKTADVVRLTAALDQKTAIVNDLSARVDELARAQRANDAGGPSNLELVARVNRLTEEAQTLRQENSRLKRERQNAGGGERVR